MKTYHLLKGDKPTEVKREEFIAACRQCLATKGIEAEDWKVNAALSVLESGTSPWELGDGRIAEPTVADKAFYEALEDCWKINLKLTAPEVPPHVEQAQAEIEHALDAIDEIREAEIEEQEKLLEGIVGRNFTTLPNGAGLMLKEGAPLLKEDGYTCVGALTQQIGITDTVKSKCNLALVDVTNAYNTKYGEDFDPTQIMEASGKSYASMKLVYMVANHFPASKRLELDPLGVMTFAHFTGVVRKDLTAEDQDNLIRFAVKRSNTSEPVGTKKLSKLAGELAKVPSNERSMTIQKIDDAKLSTDEAVDALRRVQVASGEVPDARRRWLYIYEDYRCKLSNEYCPDLSLKAVTVIRLTDLKYHMGPETFDEIDFVYVPPKEVEADPVDIRDEAYADYHLFYNEAGKLWMAVGNEGSERCAWDLDATNAEEALAEMVDFKNLDESHKDKQGRKFHFRYEA